MGEIMNGIYECVDYNIEEAVNEGKSCCIVRIDGQDKPWEQIYKERELIEKYCHDLGFECKCLGYSRPCMSDRYEISW